VISNNGSSSVSAARIEPMPTALGAGVTSTEHFPGAAVTVFPPKRHRRAGPAGFPLHARLSHKLVRKPVRQLIVRQHCSERLAEGPAHVGRGHRDEPNRASPPRRCGCNLLRSIYATASSDSESAVPLGDPLRRCPEPGAGHLLRGVARQALAEQLCEQFVGGVDAVGVFERVEIHQEPAYHGERERC
jgi:hypothetical protein